MPRPRALSRLLLNKNAIISPTTFSPTTSTRDAQGPRHYNVFNNSFMNIVNNILNSKWEYRQRGKVST